MTTQKEWDAIPAEDKALVIRTCAEDMSAHGGFKWPDSGIVVCPDWNPRAECGNGLHGLLDGYGNYSLTSNALEAKWLLVEVVRSECVDLGGKVKFPRANVIYSGGMADALTRISAYQIKLLLNAAKGAAETTTVSDQDYSRLAASGYDSRLAASGNDSRLAASGENSRVASVGYNSRAKAGKGGCICLTWYSEKTQRPRMSVAYVGEKGIKADTWYRLDANGKFVEA